MARVAVAGPAAGVGPDARDRPLQLLGALLGTCVLLTLAWWWRRPALPPDLPRLPEPGTLGPDSPPPTASLAVYRAGPDEHAAVLGRLLAGLARTHPVLLAAPPSLDPGSVFGGPVFRARAPTPAAVRRDLRALRRAGHRDPVVLLVTDRADPELLDRFRAAMPEGVGLSVLAMA